MSTEKINLENLTYKMDKREAARKAVTQYPCQPADAVIQYMILTGIMELLPEESRRTPQSYGQFSSLDIHLLEDKSLCEELSETLLERARIQAAAKKEMLDLLPGYRHPCNDLFAEALIFRHAEICGQMKTLVTPCWLKELEETQGVPKSTIIEINNLINSYGEARSKVKEWQQVVDTFEKAKNTYILNSQDRSDTRNRKVVQALGFSTGKVKPRIVHKAAYHKYIKLIRHQGLSREDATSNIQDHFGYQSRDSTLKALHGCVNDVLRQWKEESLSVFEGNNVQQYFTGLVLPRR